MTLLIVEDEPIHADRFEMLAEQLGYAVAGVYDNAFDALDCFHRSAPDVLLLDINLRGDVDGIQLAERIHRIRPVPVVFVTALQDDETFALAQRTRPEAFILKPFDSLQLQRAIELAVSRLSEADAAAPPDFGHNDLVLSDCFFVKVRGKLEKVTFDDILFLEADGRHCLLHTAQGNKFAIRIPLSDLESKLPAADFARTHRSYVIALRWLKSVDIQNMLVLVKDRPVPLSRSHREAVLGRFEQL